MRLARFPQPQRPGYRFHTRSGDFPTTSAAPRTRPAVFWVPALFGLALLLGWGAWWSESIRQDHLIGARSLWVPALPFLAGDFVVSIDPAARYWAAGGNPYDTPSFGKLYIYPPLVSRLFGWTSLVRPELAVGIWLAATTALAAAGAWWSWRTRCALGLDQIPLPLLIAAILYSTPALYLIERGQCDLLIMTFLMGAVVALRRETRWGDIAAGLFLVACTYVKYYPGLLILGALALRRWLTVVSFCSAGVVAGLLDFHWIRASLSNLRPAVGLFIAPKGFIFPLEHSISRCWKPFWESTGWTGLTRIPGTWAAVALVLPLVLSVSVCVYRSRRTASMIYPYFLWIVAAATFVPAMANDYNLLFLPMAAVAVWDRRDSALVHVLMGYLLVWWQPFALVIDGKLVLLCKLAGLAAVGLCLIRRTGEQAEHQLANPIQAEDALLPS